MLSISDSDRLVLQHLGDTTRARHSRLVGKTISHLAERFAEEADLWEIDELCHDLDFFAVADDWARHGVQTMQWLDGQLPGEALAAIAAHDHRTGIQADSLLADMLKLADATAIIVERLGAKALSGAPEKRAEGLRVRLGGRAYLADILDHQCERHGLAADAVLGFASSPKGRWPDRTPG